MKIYECGQLPVFDEKVHTAVTVGKFDGLHIGHQAVLEGVLEQKKNGLESVILFIKPDTANGVKIYDDATFLKKLEHYDIDHVIYLQLSTIKSTDPVDFIENFLVKQLHMAYFSCGDDFHFGKDRAGDVVLLAEYDKKGTFKLNVINAVTYKDERVSSTRIRKLISDGCINDVKECLGD